VKLYTIAEGLGLIEELGLKLLTEGLGLAEALGLKLYEIIEDIVLLIVSEIVSEIVLLLVILITSNKIYCSIFVQIMQHKI
jgi:hypothetical protein